MKCSNKQNQIILYLYVDDLLITRLNDDELMKSKASMMHAFEMSDSGNLCFFTGMEFNFFFEIKT